MGKSSKEKWNYNYKLKKVDLNLLPEYLNNNKNDYIKWLDN